MAISQPMDRQTFLKNLRRSGLVAEAELSQWLKQVPDSERGKHIARALVKLGALTRFQAERLLVGRTSGFLIGPYRVLDELGRGGAGRVYKAEHRALGRLVALKVLAPDLVDDERARDLFLREARAVAGLVHPNVVAAYDATESNDRYFLVLEYVDGPNLDQLVRKQGPLPVDQACEYVRQVAAGLEAAHRLGMVHRDIKPANLLVQRATSAGTSGGLVKISDFGLARLQSSEETDNSNTICVKQNTVLGTPDFLSPEQCRSLHATDIRSDLYSLGCTFYFLLTGQVVFPGGSSIDKLIRHNVEAPPSLLNARPDVPAEVAAILAKLLQKAPHDRFQTPTELIEELSPFSVSGPIAWAPLATPSNPFLDVNATPGNTCVESRPEWDLDVIDDLEEVDPETTLPPDARKPERQHFLQHAYRMLRCALGRREDR